MMSNMEAVHSTKEEVLFTQANGFTINAMAREHKSSKMGAPTKETGLMIYEMVMAPSPMLTNRNSKACSRTV